MKNCTFELSKVFDKFKLPSHLKRQPMFFVQGNCNDRTLSHSNLNQISTKKTFQVLNSNQTISFFIRYGQKSFYSQFVPPSFPRKTRGLIALWVALVGLTFPGMMVLNYFLIDREDRTGEVNEAKKRISNDQIENAQSET